MYIIEPIAELMLVAYIFFNVFIHFFIGTRCEFYSKLFKGTYYTDIYEYDFLDDFNNSFFWLIYGILKYGIILFLLYLSGFYNIENWTIIAFITLFISLRIAKTYTDSKMQLYTFLYNKRDFVIDDVFESVVFGLVLYTNNVIDFLI